MNISAILPAITFAADAPAGTQVTKVVTVTGANPQNTSETGTFSATLGSDDASTDVPIVLLAPSAPTFTVTSTPSVSLEVTGSVQTSPGTYEVTIVATKL